MHSLFSLVLSLFLIFFNFEASAHQQPTLLIKMATRGRFKKFFAVLDKYYDLLSKDIPYYFVISCDTDDPAMNTNQVKKRLDSYPNLSYYFGECVSKIEACNRDIEKHLDFDILILASDDMIPQIPQYDKVIVEDMRSHHPSFDGVLHYNDGVRGINLNTMPIIGKKYYGRFSYVYYPEYLSYFCDTEFTYVSWKLKKSRYSRLVLFKHDHYTVNPRVYDGLYKRNKQFYEHDRLLFNLRQKQGYPTLN